MSSRWRSLVLAILAIPISHPEPARAVDLVTRCDAVCTANCQLDDDLKCCSDAELCKGLGPIQLQNGADLDLNGKTLRCYCGTTTCIGGTNNNVECTEASQCPGGTCGNDTGCSACSSLVLMTSANAVVKDTSNGVGRITGNATAAIDCDQKSGSRVTGVTLELLPHTGILDCAKVDENYVMGDYFGADGNGIATAGVASTDFIRDNFVDNFNVGILVSGTAAATVETNFVSMRRYASSYTGVYGIDVQPFTGSGLIVRNNVIMGSQGTGYRSDPGATDTNNSCDPANATPGNCSAPTAPYALP